MFWLSIKKSLKYLTNFIFPTNFPNSESKNKENDSYEMYTVHSDVNSFSHLTFPGLSLCIRYYWLLQENATVAHWWEKQRLQIPVHTDVRCRVSITSQPSRSAFVTSSSMWEDQATLGNGWTLRTKASLSVWAQCFALPLKSVWRLRNIP